MSLHFSKDGYTFRADAGSLTIEPGPKAAPLSRAELEQLGLSIQDDYQNTVTGGRGARGVIDSILAALKEALTRCRGPEEISMARDLKRAIILSWWPGRERRAADSGPRGDLSPCIRAGRVLEEGAEEQEDDSEDWLVTPCG